MSETKNVPEIRFEGYNTEWQERNFGDISFPVGERNTLNLPLESYSITNVDGFIPQTVLFEHGGKMSMADKSKSVVVPPKSFAYNPARINVGSIGYLKLDKSVLISPLYEIFQTNDKADDQFIWQWLKSERLFDLIKKYQEGSVRLCFYYEQLKLGELKLPTLPEQQRLGAFFSALDRLIAQQRRKYEKLQNLKKSMLEKMFPKDGESAPEIRFKGFEGAWRKVELGEIVILTKGQQRGKKELSDYGLYYVLNGGMTPSGYTDAYNTEAGVISISEGGNSCGYVNYNTKRFWSGGHNYTLLQPKIDTMYLYHFLKFKENDIMNLRVGSGLPNIQKGRLQEVEVDLPSPKEQNAIANYFTKLDCVTIGLETNLVKLTNLKQSLLQKMFV